MEQYDPALHMLADDIAASTDPPIARKTVLMAQTRARAARRQAALLAEGGMDAAQADREADNGPWQLPEQVGKLTRRVGATDAATGKASHDRTVTQPYWRRDDITGPGGWLRHRRGPGGRSAADAGRETAEVA